MSFASAAVAAVWLHFDRASGSRRIFAALLLAIAGFWIAGELIIGGVADRDDLAFVLRSLALHPLWFWRAAMALGGGFLYIAVLRRAAADLPRGRPLAFAYLINMGVACIAAVFYRGDFAPALREGILESLGGCGLLYLAVFSPGGSAGVDLPGWSPRLVGLAVVIVVVFWFSLGRGILA
jgi:hypothetical protein